MMFSDLSDLYQEVEKYIQRLKYSDPPLEKEEESSSYYKK
jgi:hypothetical protein